MMVRRTLLGETRRQIEQGEPFTAIERRLSELTNQFLHTFIVLVRCDGIGEGVIDAPRPLTARVVGQASRLALAAAVEVEDQLRRVRTQMEGGEEKRLTE